MKKIKVLFAIICIALMATMAPLASYADEADEIVVTIDVAPNVINLGSSSTWVTVHTDIAYSLVVDATVVLFVEESDDIPEVKCFPDQRGNLVAKFHMTDVKTELPDAGMCTFKLSGYTVNSDEFCGVQIIKVFDNSGQSGGKM